MKTTKLIIIFFVIAFFLTSCIDIINLKLHNSNPQIVLEANVDITDSTCIVKASYSNGFYDTTEIHYANGLKIKLTNLTTNTSYTLVSQDSGNYFIKNVIANDNDNFELQVTDSTEKIFTAKAQTPENPPKYVIVFKTIPNHTFTDSNGIVHKMLYALAFWTDTSANPTYYRITYFKHNEYINSNNISDDSRAINDTMQMGVSNLFLQGDTILFKLLTINKETYEYFNQLRDVQMSGFSSTAPYNPHNNWDNNALGYFCVQRHKDEVFIVTDYPFPF